MPLAARVPLSGNGTEEPGRPERSSVPDPARLTGLRSVQVHLRKRPTGPDSPGWKSQRTMHTPTGRWCATRVRNWPQKQSHNHYCGGVSFI